MPGRKLIFIRTEAAVIEISALAFFPNPLAA
jgi:hypothetical protein